MKIFDIRELTRFTDICQIFTLHMKLNHMTIAFINEVFALVYAWLNVQLFENLGFSRKIQDYRSKIQVFHLKIQDFQEKLGHSIENPRYSAKNLDYRLKIQVYRITGHLASKILDFQLIIKVF